MFVDMKFVVLSDITSGMKKPCVMDVKIGLQTWEPGCSEKKRKDENVIKFTDYVINVFINCLLFHLHVVMYRKSTSNYPLTCMAV